MFIIFSAAGIRKVFVFYHVERSVKTIIAVLVEDPQLFLSRVTEKTEKVKAESFVFAITVEGGPRK